MKRRATAKALVLLEEANVEEKTWGFVVEKGEKGSKVRRCMAEFFPRNHYVQRVVFDSHGENITASWIYFFNETCF